MAGRGPAPKDPSKKVRSDPRDKTARTFSAEPVAQPPLPADMEWHPRTIAWWATWKTAPQAQEFVATDWDFLLDTALMHTAMWAKGQWTLAAEVRLRVAKVGATPEDRARLKMIFASGKDAAPAPTGPLAQQRYGALQVVPDAAEA